MQPAPGYKEEEILKLDRKLNLVIPLYETIMQDDKEVQRPRAYVHSTPILAATFDRYYLSLAKTHSAIFGEGLGTTSGPRVAAKILRDRAKEVNDWEGLDGVRSGLVGEIHRLTNVMRQGAQGWETIPYEQALAIGAIDEEEADVLENVLTFFTVGSALLPPQDKKALMIGLSRLWDAQSVSSNCTEFLASLKISMPAGSTPAATGPSDPLAPVPQ